MHARALTVDSATDRHSLVSHPLRLRTPTSETPAHVAFNQVCLSHVCRPRRHVTRGISTPCAPAPVAQNEFSPPLARASRHLRPSRRHLAILAASHSRHALLLHAALDQPTTSPSCNRGSISHHRTASQVAAGPANFPPAHTCAPLPSMYASTRKGMRRHSPQGTFMKPGRATVLRTHTMHTHTHTRDASPATLNAYLQQNRPTRRRCRFDALHWRPSSFGAT